MLIFLCIKTNSSAEEYVMDCSKGGQYQRIFKYSETNESSARILEKWGSQWVDWCTFEEYLEETLSDGWYIMKPDELKVMPMTGTCTEFSIVKPRETLPKEQIFKGVEYIHEFSQILNFENLTHKIIETWKRKDSGTPKPNADISFLFTCFSM